MENEKTFTFTLTEQEAAQLIRAAKARAAMWTDIEHINRENATLISRKYRALAKNLEQQMKQQ